MVKKYNKLLNENTIINFEKDIFKLSNVNHETWFIMHLIDEKYIEDFFKILKCNFICPKCRQHLNEYNKNVITRKQAIDLHNDVNERIERPILNESGKKKILDRDFTDFYPTLRPDGIFYILLLTYINNKEIFEHIVDILGYDKSFKNFERFEDFYKFFIKNYFLYNHESLTKDNFEKVRLEICLLDNNSLW